MIFNNIKGLIKYLAFYYIAVLTIMVFNIQSANAAMEDFDTVKLQALDKITARTSEFNAKVGSTIQYGTLFIKIQACRKAPPIEKPESTAFLQIWQNNIKNEPEWVFSGWMFASSPALSPMDHPIYDVWVLDCVGEKVERIEIPEINLPAEENTQQVDKENATEEIKEPIKENTDETYIEYKEYEEDSAEENTQQIDKESTTEEMTTTIENTDETETSEDNLDIETGNKQEIEVEQLKSPF